ncbi:MarR family winged helix-turn-helix transcriptional regulator [Ostreiculturibacter nitratireducens]|uniref:MarR family winged helix-turn-helix transcriptional regulator n=1 Tax=Ostreiculturibacter nitratireducens TaxID=3075226 RepID=UPI0031B597D8
MSEDPAKGRSPDDVDLGPLSDSLGFLLRLSQLASFRDFFDRFDDLGIRPGEVSVLMLVGRNPGVRQGVLARQLMIKRAHMTKMARAMEDDGLITRSVPDDDKRSVELWLTEKGAERVDRLREPFLAHEARPVPGLTAREAETLKRLLRKYLDLPQDPKDSRP